MATRVWPVDAVSGAPLYSGRMLRQSLMAPLVAGATTARPLGARSGVRPGTSTTTVTATSTTWTCRPHAGILDLETATEAGPYGYAIDANATGAVTAANATNPRVDIIYVQLSDPAEADGTSTPGVAVGYLAGTAAASPVAPTTPARSMVIAQINVPISGGGSPSVTWVAPYAVAAGGIIPVRTQAERDLITWGAAENPAQVYRLDMQVVERNAGAGWFAASIGPWITYSPTLTLTVGSGGSSAFSYRREGNLIRVRYRVTLGSGAGMSQPRFSLPVTSAALQHSFEVTDGAGSAWISGAVWPSIVTLVSTTQAQINYRTSGALLDFSLSAPATFSVGDVLAGGFTYLAA